MRDPRYNKGLAFTDKERDAHYITGLLPPVVLSQEVQVYDYDSISITVNSLFLFCLRLCWFQVCGYNRRRRWCTISASTRFLCSVTWPSWIFRWFHCYPNIFAVSLVLKVGADECESFRKETRDCFTSFWLTMWRNCFRLCTPRQWGRLAKSMGAFTGGHKVFTSAWKRSEFFYTCCNATMFSSLFSK